MWPEFYTSLCQAEATNEVTSGENHGRDLSHRQIVDKPVEVVMDDGEVHGELGSNGIDQVILLVWEGEELVAAADGHPASDKKSLR